MENLSRERVRKGQYLLGKILIADITSKKSIELVNVDTGSVDDGDIFLSLEADTDGFYDGGFGFGNKENCRFAERLANQRRKCVTVLIQLKLAARFDCGVVIKKTLGKPDKNQPGMPLKRGELRLRRALSEPAPIIQYVIDTA